MIRINLLPFRATRKQENIKHQVVIFLLSFVLTLSILFFVHFQFGRKVHALQTDIENKQTLLAAYQAKADEAKELDEYLEKVKERMDEIGKLQGDRSGPVHLLDDLTKWVVPKRMWITNLENSHGKLTIQGIAIDNKTVATFLRRLEDSGQFAEVRLLAVQKKLDATEAMQKLKDFDIVCLKPGAEDEEGGEQ